jgi:NAD(P)-dependent dehydrogenase (short-subunit alcohol dehydrogenase family)
MDKSYNGQREALPSSEPPLRVAITGGTAGLGLALVREFRGRGAEVAFVARGEERVQRVARELSGSHGIAGDLARKVDIHPIALQVTGCLGGLDVLVNNASSLGPVPLALLADTECEQLELALATNLVGPFRLSRALLGALSASARQRRGAVIQRHQRRRDQPLPALGRLWRQQSRAAASEPDLGCRIGERWGASPHPRSRRHGYGAARGGTA